MKDLIITFCEVCEWGWDAKIVPQDDLDFFRDLGWICEKDEVTQEGHQVYKDNWEVL